MLIAMVSLVGGWLLASLLMFKLSFVLAWLTVTIIGIVVQVHINNDSVAYWMMIGAMIPIFLLALKTL